MPQAPDGPDGTEPIEFRKTRFREYSFFLRALDEGAPTRQLGYSELDSDPEHPTQVEATWIVGAGSGQSDCPAIENRVRQIRSVTHLAVNEIVACGWDEDDYCAVTQHFPNDVEGVTIQRSNINAYAHEIRDENLQFLREIALPIAQALRAMHLKGVHHGNITSRSVRFGRRNSYGRLDSLVLDRFAFPAAGSAPGRRLGQTTVERPLAHDCQSFAIVVTSALARDITAQSPEAALHALASTSQLKTAPEPVIDLLKRAMAPVDSEYGFENVDEFATELESLTGLFTEYSAVSETGFLILTSNTLRLEYGEVLIDSMIRRDFEEGGVYVTLTDSIGDDHRATFHAPSSQQVWRGFIKSDCILLTQIGLPRGKWEVSGYPWRPTRVAQAGVCTDELITALVEAREHERDAGVSRAIERWQSVVALESTLIENNTSEWLITGAERMGNSNRNIIFQVRRKNVDDDHEITIDQRMHLCGQDGNARYDAEVTATAEDRVTLAISRSLNRASLEALVSLRPDLTFERNNVARKLAALDDLRARRTANRNLRSIVADPLGSVTKSDDLQIRVPTYLDNELDPDKQRVVRRALSVPSLFLVHGPPGTGKTTLIVELIRQVMQRSSESRVLISSQTNVALDVAVKRLSDMSELRIVRVGSRAGDDVEHLSVASQVEKWRHQAALDAWLYTSRRAREAGIDPAAVSACLVVDNADFASNAIDINDPIVKAFFANTPEVLKLATANEMERRAARDEYQKPYLHSDEFAEICRGAKIQLKWLTGFSSPPRRGDVSFGGPSTEDLLLQRADVIAATCMGVGTMHTLEEMTFDFLVLDEASKASPAEAMIPMSRSMKTILVGDTKQLPPHPAVLPHNPKYDELLNEYEISDGDLRESILSFLESELLDTLATQRAAIEGQLTDQHRSIAPIGNLISDVFYDGSLETKRTSPPSLEVPLLKTPVVWIDTAGIDNNERGQNSNSNNTEVQIIRYLVAHICASSSLTDEAKTIDVNILTGYRDQARALNQMLRRHANANNSFRLGAYTVDSFQGQECDVAVFSAVRSRAVGNHPGFLKEEYRINVALSRARDYLVIVGDLAFFRTMPHLPMGRVATYMATHPVSCSTLSAKDIRDL